MSQRFVDELAGGRQSGGFKVLGLIVGEDLVLPQKRMRWKKLSCSRRFEEIKSIFLKGFVVVQKVIQLETFRQLLLAETFAQVGHSQISAHLKSITAGREDIGQHLTPHVQTNQRRIEFVDQFPGVNTQFVDGVILGLLQHKLESQSVGCFLFRTHRSSHVRPSTQKLPTECTDSKSAYS